uniref:Uncharacterized protein n=1 Tax=Amphilophus citrinellus TaxID=61819 RepID=A0A3Q0T356_AMPCI
EKVIENVPDDLGTKIPRPLLVDFSSSNFVVTNLNKKKWIHQQVEDEILLSSSVLQGFTCTGVRAISIVQIKKLIRACRRTGSNKVTLVETQLTCMYNYIKGDGNTTVFSLYPPDVLLYYDYSLVPQASCRSYLTELGDADFSVFSPALSYIRTALFENAKSCLGITNTSLTADNISVLGNMCCILDGLTAWTVQTLKDLGMLPLYLTSTFYDYFDQVSTTCINLQVGFPLLTAWSISHTVLNIFFYFFIYIYKILVSFVSATDCTGGFITRVTISSEAFPLDYSDINQFNNCLNATIVRDNLDAITQKLDQDDYLKIVLSKLRQVENQVQVLSVASRVATVEDISMWTITEIDTLAALMDPINGMWDPNLVSRQNKYLSIKGNSLGTAEINTIGGPNLCSLDVQVLKNISQETPPPAQPSARPPAKLSALPPAQPSAPPPAQLPAPPLAVHQAHLQQQNQHQHQQ